jgi:hypothetical protein
MWRKPEENKPQSALDALPSTVPSPQRPAAAVPPDFSERATFDLLYLNGRDLRQLSLHRAQG